MSAEQTVFAENLALWHEEARENRELRLLQIDMIGERAGTAWRSGTPEDRTEIIAWISGERGQSSAFERMLAVDEQIAFCRAFRAACPNFLPPEAAIQRPLPKAGAYLRAACLPGPFAEAALAAFSPALHKVRPLSAASFTAVCEEVTAGNAAFAILPLEDTEEGKFQHTYALLDRYELRILATCDVSYPDGGRSMRMALVAAAPYPLGELTGERLLECELFGEEPHTLSDFLLAAQGCGLSLRRVDSLSSPYREDAFFYRPIFRIEGESDALFEIYLALFHPRATVVARYTNIKEKN